MLSGRGLCDELITRPEESYRLCCVVVCDLEISRMGAPYIYDISHLSVNEIHGIYSRQNLSLEPVTNKDLKYFHQALFIYLLIRQFLFLGYAVINCPLIMINN